MVLKAVMESYVHDSFKKDAEAAAAVREFLKNIPARILQTETDPSDSIKIGVKKDDSIYKYGTVPEEKTAFFEYYEHRAQGRPTMALYLDRALPKLKVTGTKLDRNFYLTFTLAGGAVTKQVKFE